MSTDPARRATSPGRSGSRFAALFERKLTPGIALLFFVALALMCAAAAGIGYVTQNMRHAAVHQP